MAALNMCPHCGAYLDPGEKCTCLEEAERKAKRPQIHPGDVIRYAPTGEIWDVCGICEDRGMLVPETEGAPMSVLIEDCELIEAMGQHQTIEQAERLKRYGFVAYIER